MNRADPELISARTIAALTERRAAGTRLGRPRLCPDTVLHRVVFLRREGAKLADIAHVLNRSGISTPGGGPYWYPSHVSRLLRTQDAIRLLRAHGETAV